MKKTTLLALSATTAVAVVGGPVASSEAACQAGQPQTSYYCTPSAPVVTTGAANPVISTAAAIGGTVNPNGQNTTFRIEYGTTAALGQATATAPVPSTGYNPVNVTALIGGLAPSTTYFYRVSATNSSGTITGAIQQFRTAAGGVVTPPATGKLLPKLSLSASPSRDRVSPFRFRASGRLTLPTGVSRLNGCKGRVSISLLRGQRVIARQATNLSSTCRYSKSVTARNERLRRVDGRYKGTLTLRVRFLGNDALRAKSAPRRTVRYGPR